MFKVQVLSESRPLEVVAIELFQRFGLVSKLKLTQEKLNSFFKVGHM